MNRVTSKLRRPIFIVGPGRSGTTLVRSILSAHTQMIIAPETHFMVWAEKNGLESGYPESFTDFWNQYINTRWFKDVGVEKEKCLEILNQGNNNSFKEIFASILLAYKEKFDSVRVGEKTPGHTRFLSYLFRWFPDAQVVLMIRDPRAVIASQLRTPYVKKRLSSFSLSNGFILGNRLHEIAFYADNWKVIYNKRVNPWIDDSRLMVVSYEKLVSNTKNTLKSLCEFLNEPYEDRMLTRRTNNTVRDPAENTEQNSFSQWREKHHEKSVSPISSDSIGKWKNELSAMEISVIEAHCSTLMKSYGYSLSSDIIKRSAGWTTANILLSLGGIEAKLRKTQGINYQRARKVHVDSN